VNPQGVNPQGVNPQAAPVLMPGQVPPPVQVPTEQQQQPVNYPSTPTNPYGGVAVPGMMVPTPQPQQPQPGQIVPPAQQPRRPGGPGGPDRID
jgi:hypothetical protein